ncbi:MAG TPA: hypothetical protein PKI12_03520, partial [Bacteroidales bacterium]|nr:hypothetical protein [Bacteroidales bacterium]
VQYRISFIRFQTIAHGSGSSLDLFDYGIRIIAGTTFCSIVPCSEIAMPAIEDPGYFSDNKTGKQFFDQLPVVINLQNG